MWLETLVDGGKTPQRVVLRARVEAIVNATLHTTPRDATHWSVRSLAQAQRISPATVHRIWQAATLQPHRTKTFKLSRDPHFVRKLRDVVGLYMNPPAKALLLPLRPGLPACQPRHTHTEFLAFLDKIDRQTSRRREIHLILDNYSTHKHPTVTASPPPGPRG